MLKQARPAQVLAAASTQLPMNVFKAILLKLVSALLFAVMQALVRALGDVTPVGQVVFFRAAFAILPVVLIYAWRRELRPRCVPSGRSGISGAA